MARIPRLYRVRSVHRDGKIEHRHYQTPEAAEERRERFEQADPEAIVSVTPSHPVIYPNPTGDIDPFAIPDGIVSRGGVGRPGVAARPGPERHPADRGHSERAADRVRRRPEAPWPARAEALAGLHRGRGDGLVKITHAAVAVLLVLGGLAIAAPAHADGFDPASCPPGTVPGWLDENGVPTSCVGDHPCPEYMDTVPPTGPCPGDPGYVAPAPDPAPAPAAPPPPEPAPEQAPPAPEPAPVVAPAPTPSIEPTRAVEPTASPTPTPVPAVLVVPPAERTGSDVPGWITLAVLLGLSGVGGIIAYIVKRSPRA